MVLPSFTVTLQERTAVVIRHLGSLQTYRYRGKAVSFRFPDSFRLTVSYFRHTITQPFDAAQYLV